MKKNKEISLDSESIFEVVRKLEQDWTSETPTKISKYVDFVPKKNLDTIDAYVNSSHTSGKFDDLGREKPFFNIVNAARNIWYRATDIDRKNIKIRATRANHALKAFIANVLVQEWMRKSRFGMFLNDWGRSLATYGSSMIKMVEKDSELYATIVPWSQLIIDARNVEDSPIVEVLELTQSQLIQRIDSHGYDKEKVFALISSLEARRGTDNQKIDNKSDFIRLYEVHGVMPLSLITEKEEDEQTYVQQMHIISYVEKDKEFNDFTLVSGREKKNPYILTHLMKEEGRSMAIGSVENLFEAQWMVNHTAFQIKNQLDLASKVIFQTSDTTYLNQNALNAIETGDIMIHAANQPLTQVNNQSHDVTSLQNLQSQWKQLGNELNGVSEAMLGQNPPAGSAWRQTEALLNESHSLFELMTENKGMYIEEMMQEFVIPHQKSKLNTKEEISGFFSSNEIEKIDSKYISSKVNENKKKVAIKGLLSGQPATPEDMDMVEQQTTQSIQESFRDLGNQRFFVPDDIGQQTWKEFFADMEWEVEVDVTGEVKDVSSMLTTLNTVLTTLATNPTIMQNKPARMVLNKILMATGAISPVELADIEESATAAPAVAPQPVTP